MTETTYKLDELARAAGTSARTVRYYVQRGLLPAPQFRGKDTAYGREHLVRLRAIRRLQEAFLPLDAIAAELERRSLGELERLAESGEGVPVARPPEPPVPLRTTSRAPAKVVRRFAIAEGVDLELAEDAPPESRRLVEQILRDLEAK